MKDSKIRFKRRLLNVARALREDESSDPFSMNCMSNNCGTPGCALGHYAFRRDLQKTFSFIPHAGSIIGYRGYQIKSLDLAVREHFNITANEAYNLFSAEGCGNAQDVITAAEFIENFVADKADAGCYD